jgi:hypothetical protein
MFNLAGLFLERMETPLYIGDVAMIVTRELWQVATDAIPGGTGQEGLPDVIP